MRRISTLSENEIEFLREMRVCRIATATANGEPHVVPVWYAFDGSGFYIITDYGTKKLRNVRENNRVSLVIDLYSGTETKGIVIFGEAEVLEAGAGYKNAERLLKEKYTNWRNYQPWGEGSAPIIKISAVRSKSWGFDSDEI